MKKSVILITVIISLLTWGCSKIDKANLSFKDSLDKGVSDINKAITSISSTTAYQILIADEPVAKAETGFNDSIALSLVAGIYEFKPDFQNHQHEFFIPYRIFEKTGTSDSMIVHLPQKLIFHSKYLHNINPPDSVSNKDFTILASDYHYYYTRFNQFDYKLSAGFVLDSEDIGNLDIVSQGNKDEGRSYSSTYSFNDGYNINVSYQSGDSSVTSFSLVQDDDILMKETIIRIWKDYHMKERMYILSIGNVDIIRGSDIDSIEVYLDGVLQQAAAAKITDPDSEGSFCHHRDILLTFNDGTTENLSDLIKPAKDMLGTLVDSMHSMKFAKNVIDYIAFSIYYHSWLLTH